MESLDALNRENRERRVKAGRIEAGRINGEADTVARIGIHVTIP